MFPKTKTKMMKKKKQLVRNEIPSSQVALNVAQRGASFTVRPVEANSISTTTGAASIGRSRTGYILAIRIYC